MGEITGQEAMRFEHAETEAEAAPAACAFCSEPIAGVYYQVGLAIVCESCRGRLQAEREAGSGVGRWSRAALFGTGTAVVGALLWYLVAELTGYEFGLIAIVIGLLVGGAVRVGSRRRGGWVYQGLAMFLTYASIVSTYVPAIFEGLNEAAEAAEESGAIVEANAEIEPSATLAAGREAEAGELASGSEDHGGPLVGGALGALLGLGLFALFVLAAPIIAGFENFMGWIIIAIGLYEAWKLNTREALVFEGPFRMAGGRPEIRAEPLPPAITPA